MEAEAQELRVTLEIDEDDKGVFFQFADAQRVEKGEEENPHLKDVSSFHAVIFRANMITDSACHPNKQRCEERVSVDEKKKFWKAPSLFTTGGRIRGILPPQRCLENVSLVGSFRGYYHCPLVINLLRNISSDDTLSMPSKELSSRSSFSIVETPSSLLVKRENPGGDPEYRPKEALWL
eukprot:scaffold642_cov166-Ochromonas_danica.AAC.14